MFQDFKSSIILNLKLNLSISWMKRIEFKTGLGKYPFQWNPFDVYIFLNNSKGFNERTHNSLTDCPGLAKCAQDFMKRNILSNVRLVFY